MEATVNLKSVQAAICQLRDRGERVSRRNVRSITGGGMSTVHRLMNEAEELERLKTVDPMALSENFYNAILDEIGMQIKATTSNLQDEIRQLQARELEALEALAEVEEKKDHLAEDIKNKSELATRLQNRIETTKAIANDTILRLEQNISDLQEECIELSETIETLNIQIAKCDLQTSMAKQDADQAEKRFKDLSAAFQAHQKTHSETERTAAASAQKAADLEVALVKAEKRIKVLEQSLISR
jgi:chromosome segregation ATPase